MSRPLPAVATTQCGVFTTDQAAAEGWTEAMLETDVRRRVVDRLWRGVYARPVTRDAEGEAHRATQSAIGAALAHHDLAVSHLATAALWQLPSWAPAPRACVTTPRSTLSSAAGVHVHRCALPVEDFATYGALDTTTPARAVVDIACEFGTEAALVTADAALRTGLTSRGDLLATLARATRRPGVKAARAAVELADPRAESPLETRSRWRLLRANLPPPRPQAVIRDLDGRFVARVDFLWEELGVVGEADGRAKYARDMTRRSSEGRRRDALERLGLLYESWGWDDLEPFAPTEARIAAALRRAAVLPAQRRRWRVDA